jgi:hypothetical protein
MFEEKELGLLKNKNKQDGKAHFPSKREESVRIYHNAIEHFHLQQLSQNKNNSR